MKLSTIIKTEYKPYTTVGYFEYQELKNSIICYQYKKPVDQDGKPIYGVNYKVLVGYRPRPFTQNYEGYYIAVHKPTGLTIGIVEHKRELNEYLKVWSSYQWTLGAEKDTLIGTSKKGTKIIIRSFRQHTIEE